MNNLIKDEVNIEGLIYEIRGVQVMLDSDLANFMSVLTVQRQLIKQLKDI